VTVTASCDVSTISVVSSKASGKQTEDFEAVSRVSQMSFDMT